MQRILALLAVILFSSISLPASAGMADCDGPTTPDEVEAREMLDLAAGIGTSPLHTGFLELLNTCEAVKRKFNAALAGLGATPERPPTDPQIEGALTRIGQSPGGAGACLWNFDAAACKRYLGIADAEDPVSGAAAPDAAGNVPATRKAMSFADALAARRRVIDEDTRAHTAVGANGTSCRAGADACRSMLESTVDPVIRQADELNADPEYQAQLPAYTLASVDFANRMGWTRQSG